MKCGRCQRDVPVLTPSPDGDLDLCEECYATVFQERMGKRKAPTGAIVGAVVLALVVVGAAYVAFSGSGGDPTTSPDSKNLRASLDGPKKNVARSVKPRTRRKPRRRPKPSPERPPAPEKKTPVEGEQPPEEEPATDEAFPPEDRNPDEQPAPEDESEKTEEKPESEALKPEPSASGQIETALYSLAFRSSSPAGTASVSLTDVEGEEESSAVIEPREGALCELSLSLTLKDVPEAADEVAVEGLVLIAGNAEFAPIQATASSQPYTAPSAEAAELAVNARIVLVFGAEVNVVEPFAEGGEIVELVIGLTGRPATIPVKLLFDLPSDVTEADLFLANQELPVTLRR